MDSQHFRRQVDEMLAGGRYDDIKPLLLSDKDITEHDNDLAMVCYLCTIHEQEKAAGQESVFSKVAGMEELLDRYTALKFYLRRIDFGVMDRVGMESFYQFLSQCRISSYELVRVMDFCVVHREQVLQAIQDGALVMDDADTGSVRQDMKCIQDNGEHTFCFIICTNHPAYAEECIYYINHLTIPEGFRVEVLTVEEAHSLTSGYNEAMQCSGAKYKVYLHHDTFIINPCFMQECLDIFRNNPQIGMLGNVGVETMPDSGVMWDADRYGMLYEQHIYETKLLANAIEPGKEYMEVDAIDGFLMVTQYDLPWREDIFDKWDFYDCSQSMEFIRKGYKVVVPNMKAPWCVHDCGFINLRNYDEEREKFVREYLGHL